MDISEQDRKFPASFGWLYGRLFFNWYVLLLSNIEHKISQEIYQRLLKAEKEIFVSLFYNPNDQILNSK